MTRNVPTDLLDAEIYPSSLTRALKGHVWNAAWQCWMVPVFCPSCSVAGPLVAEPSIADGTGWVCWFCEDCAVSYRDQTEVMVIPDEVYWSKVAAAMEEHYGHVLAPHEIVTELGDPNSLVSKLVRDRPKRGSL